MTLIGLASRLQNETVENTLGGNENENEKRYLAAILLDNLGDRAACVAQDPDLKIQNAHLRNG